MCKHEEVRFFGRDFLFLPLKMALMIRPMLGTLTKLPVLPVDSRRSAVRFAVAKRMCSARLSLTVSFLSHYPELIQG